jgi:hypothetical protein
MLMWVLAFVLVGGFAFLGFQLGGIRSSVGLIGALIGLALAETLGALVAPLLPKVGVQSLAWMLILPSLVGFAVVWLASLGAGFAAHRPVELHFKYREDDPTRKAFETMNNAIGLFVGMLTGVILLLAVGKPIYGQGYLTTQIHSETEPAPIGLVNSVRSGMASTGWDRTFAPLDRTPAKFNEVADILGVIYANPAVTNRIVEYPPFLALVEMQEVADVLGDPEYLKLLQDQAGFTALLSNPKTQAILNNRDIVDQLKKLDLADLRKFLETGVSPKYADERLLGRWSPDMAAIVTDARRKRANLGFADLKNLRMALNAILSKARFNVYPDGRFTLKVPPPEFPAAPAPAAPREGAAAGGSPYAMDPALAQRYGMRTRQAQGGEESATPAAPAVNPNIAAAERVLGGAKASKLPAFDGEGTWTRTGDRYSLTFTTPQPDNREAILQENGRFVIPFPDLKMTLVFVKSR